jgi:hypothetical protein
MQPSSSVSSLILRLKFISQQGLEVIYWLGFIDVSIKEEFMHDDVRFGYHIDFREARVYCAKVGDGAFTGFQSVSIHVWIVGPKSFLLGSTTLLVITLV